MRVVAAVALAVVINATVAAASLPSAAILPVSLGAGVPTPGHHHIQRPASRYRRRVNLHSGRVRLARLYSRASRSFLTVDPLSNSVALSKHGNDVYDVIEVMFLCQLAADYNIGQCPLAGRRRGVNGDVRNVTVDLILLRFKAVDRFLCIDADDARVRLKQIEDPASLTECAFRHDNVSAQYDVYYSWKHSNPDDEATFMRRAPSGTAGRRHRRRRRRRRWYLGVGKHGEIRTFRVKSVQRPTAGHGPAGDNDDGLEFKLPRRVMFFQMWINNTSDQSAGAMEPIIRRGWTLSPPSIAAQPRGGQRGTQAPADVGRLDRKSRRRRRKCSRLLRGCRSRRRRRRRRRPNSR